MPEQVWVPDDRICAAVAAIPADSFTILDFIAAYSSLFPESWDELVRAFGVRGDGSRRAYTAAVYLGNRLWQISKKPGSSLLPLERWQKGGVETASQRRTTPAERAMGQGSVIRVFRKSPGQQ